MKVSVISFGKLKTPGMRESGDYYLKLLSGWVGVDEIELKPLSIPNKSTTTRKIIQEKENQILTNKISNLNSAWIYVLDEKGKAQTTLEWATEVRKWESSGISNVVFCVGSSLGFSETLKKQNKIFSLGPQTLSHELAKVVLLEQLYRAWSVVRGHPYHNEG